MSQDALPLVVNETKAKKKQHPTLTKLRGGPDFCHKLMFKSPQRTDTRDLKKQQGLRFIVITVSEKAGQQKTVGS